MNKNKKWMEKIHYLKNSGIKDPFKELSFFNLHGLKNLGTNYVYLHENAKPHKSITFNTINWLHIGYIFIYRCIQIHK